MTDLDDDLDEYPIPPTNGCVRELLVALLVCVAVVGLLLLATKAAV